MICVRFLSELNFTPGTCPGALAHQGREDVGLEALLGSVLQEGRQWRADSRLPIQPG